MLGYYNNQKATDMILKMHRDGKLWIHTQDLGYMNDNGFVYVKGRIKRMIIRHDGFKVFPFKIEEAIASHPAVKDCMVVGVPDTNHCQGFLPKAHIVLNEEYIGKEEIVRREIAKICAERLPEYVVPTEYKFRDSIPVTDIGKKDFKALEAEDAARVLRLPTQPQKQKS
jgi:long-chain acyl-CoA synthetase